MSYITRASDTVVRERYEHIIYSVRVMRDSGMTSSDIAETLHLPLRTVNRLWTMKTLEEHVTDLYVLFS